MRDLSNKKIASVRSTKTESHYIFTSSVVHKGIRSGENFTFTETALNKPDIVPKNLNFEIQKIGPFAEKLQY